MRAGVNALLQDRAAVWLFPLIAAAIFFASRPINVPEVGPSEARSLIDSGALIVDVRGRKAYEERHLPGAISVPLGEMERAIPPSIAQAGDRPIVVYCGDGARSGPLGTRLLNDAGFARAVNLKSGLQGWSKAGFPVKP